MNLYEALLATPRERLQSISFFYGISSPDSDEKALAKAVAAHLLVPANALVAMRGLSEEETLALRLITLSAGGTGVIVEQCHRRLNQLSRKWRRNASKVVNILLARGLVFIGREDYRHIYFVPKDMLRILAGFFLSEIYLHVGVEQEKRPSAEAQDHAAPLRHLCLLLSYIRKNEVRLTQSGTIFRKAQNELGVILGETDRDDPEALTGLRYAPRLALLLYFAKSKGLIEEANGLLVLGDKAKEWAKQPYARWREEIYAYWKSSFVAQDVELLTLLKIIQFAPEGTIMSLNLLCEQMETLSTSHSIQGLDMRVGRNLIQPLEYLGALTSASVSGDTLFETTSLGRKLLASSPFAEQPYEENVYVQSNFEVLVPSTIEPKLLWEIEWFADLVKPDRMMVYRISRASVYRGFLHSYTPQMILDFLDSHSKVPVAQNVSYSITQWAMSFGRMEFKQALLLKCDSEDLADELMLSPKIRPLIQERVGPAYLLVKPGEYDRLTSVLADEGYMPRATQLPGTTPLPEPSQS